MAPTPTPPRIQPPRCGYTINISIHDNSNSYRAVETYSYMCELPAGHDVPSNPDGVSSVQTDHQFKAPHMHTPFIFTNDALQFRATYDLNDPQDEDDYITTT